MTAESGTDRLANLFRAEFGPPVEEKLALTGDPEQMSARQLLTSVTFLQGEATRLRAAVERLIPEAHDLDSTKCRDRAAQQEALSPFQQIPAKYDDDCPACDVQAALSSSPTEEKE